jgi:hypothetical protein
VTVAHATVEEQNSTDHVRRSSSILFSPKCASELLDGTDSLVDMTDRCKSECWCLESTYSGIGAFAP